MPVRTVAVVLCLMPLAARFAAAAESVDEAMRKRLVFIKASGESKSLPGQTIGDVGTGFFISGDGYILTSFHVVRKVFEEALPDSIKIVVSEGVKKSDTNQIAYLVDANAFVDIALLKTFRLDNDYPAVAIGEAGSLHSGQVLVTQGFPKDSVGPANRREMKVDSVDGPAGYTMLGSGQVDAGQSGSPVYLEDGTVVGIVKGEHTNGSEIVFVPIDRAANLTAPLNFKGLATDSFVTKIDAESEKFLGGERGKSIFSAWLKEYLRKVDLKELDSYLKDNEIKIQAKINDYVDAHLKHLVAYSYSETFKLYAFKGGEHSHKMGIYKADGDEGKLSCEATYPRNPSSDQYENKIWVSYNDLPAFDHFELSNMTGRATKAFTLQKANKDLHDPERAENALTPYQTIYFKIDDTPPIQDGPVTVLCTLQIIGTAKWTEMEHK
jgi:hypothetical protein